MVDSRCSATGRLLCSDGPRPKSPPFPPLPPQAYPPGPAAPYPPYPGYPPYAGYPPYRPPSTNGTAIAALVSRELTSTRIFDADQVPVARARVEGFALRALGVSGHVSGGGGP